MRFTLITVVASLSASAVHSSMIGSGSLVTRAGQSHNAPLSNGSSIGTSTNTSSVSSTNGESKKAKIDLKTASVSLNTTSGKGSIPTSGKNSTGSSLDEDDDPTESFNPTSNRTSNPLLGPLPKNATIDQMIVRLETKISDHEQKLAIAEKKLVLEKQKLSKLSGGNHTTNATGPIVSHPSTKSNSTGDSSNIKPHSLGITPSKKN
ncbi:secreted protein [Melampsora americana]|nr:secreted protein [Melampsora americana]